MSQKWYVVVSTECHEDAEAVADILQDLNLSAKVYEENPKGRNGSPQRKTRLGRRVLKLFKDNDTRCFTVQDVAEYLEEFEYSANSAGASLWHLEQEGDLKKMGRGVYALNKENVHE